MTTRVGTIGALWRYPVKSMLGEELPAADITARGLDGDRTHALLDTETGKVASAKNPRLWRNLLTLSASATGDGGVRITGPDGADVSHDDLSQVVGRPVALATEPPSKAVIDRANPNEVLDSGIEVEVGLHAIELPPGTFFDYSTLHLLTTATLDRIGKLSPRGSVEVQRYRPNLVIDTSEEGFVENAWIGRELAIGPQLRLRVAVPTPRCAIPTLAHGRLPRDLDALRVPAQHNRLEPLPGMGLHPCAGVHAEVLVPGRIAKGDPVLLE
ncbi:MOSC N-terminal beta barrel domain-containing protein [Kitasatospora sp. NPDC051914]|uniref:MOSC domain-containing protein n=1 Tax=Kitasatospora sp. NPDC051914 TaxID=3154945 RepID=UPI003428EBFC